MNVVECDLNQIRVSGKYICLRNAFLEQVLRICKEKEWSAFLQIQRQYSELIHNADKEFSRFYRVEKNESVRTISLSCFNMVGVNADRDLHPSYIIDGDNSVVGYLGNREIQDFKAGESLKYNSEYSYVKAGKCEIDDACRLFDCNSKIRKIPVLDYRKRVCCEYIKKTLTPDSYYASIDMETVLQESQFLSRSEMCDRKVIVSLTSYGERLSSVHYTIKSLFLQAVRPDKIVLYLAEEDSDKHIIDEELFLRLGLEIRRGVSDLKSHKKYFESMKTNSDSMILTVDDDVIYDEFMILNLLMYHRAYPKTIICNRGHRMKCGDAELLPYSKWEGEVKSEEPSYDICGTGVGGILYPVGEYRLDFLDEMGILECCILGDDLWLKAIELCNGIKTFSVGYDFLACLDGSQERALYKDNAEKGRNDFYLKKIQEYLKIDICSML